MRRHMLHVGHELHHRCLESGRSYDGIDGGEHLLDEDNHFIQLGEHGIHAHLVCAVEIVTVPIVIRRGGRRDDDEFIPHDAGLRDGDGRAARNLHAVLDHHGDGDACAVARDILYAPDGNARKEHLGLGIEPDRAAKAGVQRIVMAPAETQSAEEHNNRDKERCSPQRKGADLCLSTHAPASLR